MHDRDKVSQSEPKITDSQEGLSTHFFSNAEAEEDQKKKEKSVYLLCGKFHTEKSTLLKTDDCNPNTKMQRSCIYLTNSSADRSFLTLFPDK